MCLFTMDPDGYLKAKEYLIKIGKLEEFENNKVSVDGFSLIAYANYYKHKEQGPE